MIIVTTKERRNFPREFLTLVNSAKWKLYSFKRERTKFIAKMWSIILREGGRTFFFRTLRESTVNKVLSLRPWLSAIRRFKKWNAIFVWFFPSNVYFSGPHKILSSLILPKSWTFPRLLSRSGKQKARLMSPKKNYFVYNPMYQLRGN